MEERKLPGINEKRERHPFAQNTQAWASPAKRYNEPQREVEKASESGFQFTCHPATCERKYLSPVSTNSVK